MSERCTHTGVLVKRLHTNMPHIARLLAGILAAVSLLGSVSALETEWEYAERGDGSSNERHDRTIVKSGKSNDPSNINIGLSCIRWSGEDDYKLVIFMAWDEVISDEKFRPVTIRFDNGNPINDTWWAGGEGTVTALYSEGADLRPMIDLMMESSIMYAWLIHEGARREIKFDLSGFSDESIPVLEHCSSLLAGANR